MNKTQTTQSNISKVNRLMAELSGGNTTNRLLCLRVAANTTNRSSTRTGRHTGIESGVAETCANHRGKGRPEPSLLPT